MSSLASPRHSLNTFSAPRKLCHFVKHKQKQISVICKQTCFPGYKMIDLLYPCLRIPIVLPDTHESACLWNVLIGSVCVPLLSQSVFLPLSIIVSQINQKHSLTFLLEVSQRINCFCCVFNWDFISKDLCICLGSYEHRDN